MYSLGIFHALALVGLRRTIGADFGRHLADLLAVDAGDHDLGRLRRHDRDAFRDRIDHVVAVAERELQVLALHRRAIADAGDFELALEALGDAGHRCCSGSAREVPHMARARLRCAFGSTLIAALVHRDRHTFVERRAKACLSGPSRLTVWPSTLAVTPEGTATGSFADARHDQNTVRGFRRRHWRRGRRDPPSRPSGSTGSQCRGRY